MTRVRSPISYTMLESLNMVSSWSSKCFRSIRFSRFRLSRCRILWFLLFTWNVLLLIVVVISNFLLQSITTHIPGCFTLSRRELGPCSDFAALTDEVPWEQKRFSDWKKFEVTGPLPDRVILTLAD